MSKNNPKNYYCFAVVPKDRERRGLFNITPAVKYLAGCNVYTITFKVLPKVDLKLNFNEHVL